MFYAREERVHGARQGSRCQVSAVLAAGQYNHTLMVNSGYPIKPAPIGPF